MTVWSLKPHSQSASLKNHYYVLPISNILVKRKGNLSVKEWVFFFFLLYATCSCPHIWEGPFSKLFLSVVSALTVSECWKSFLFGCFSPCAAPAGVCQPFGTHQSAIKHLSDTGVPLTCLTSQANQPCDLIFFFFFCLWSVLACLPSELLVSVGDTIRRLLTKDVLPKKRLT